jgi:large subunit ribosomal protein L9
MASAIRVVLQQDVDSLGAGGDVVRVRPGFARNFLVPRGLALPATESTLARVEELKRLAGLRAEKELGGAREQQQRIEAVSVKIQRAVGRAGQEAGDESKMYGSVTTKDIAEAYAAQGITLDRKKIQLDEPIKQLGMALVPIKLHAKLTATLKVEVVKAG